MATNRNYFKRNTAIKTVAKEVEKSLVAPAVTPNTNNQTIPTAPTGVNPSTNNVGKEIVTNALVASAGALLNKVI